MTTATNDLPARLREHAAIHDAATSPYDDEQAQWAQDLREAASALEVVFESDRLVSGLLALIHGDGGRLQAEHGTAHACEEAIQMLADRHAELERLRKAVLPEDD